MLFAELADGSRVQGVEVIDDFLAQAERRPDRDRETESMEERQNTKQHVVRLHVNVLFHLEDVAQDVAVRQHNPLGFSRRARGEEHRGGCIQAVVLQPGNEAWQQAHRHELGHGRGPELVGRSNLLGDIFEQDELYPGE